MSAPAILDLALLDQFDARLRALGAAIVDMWAPGLSDDAIDALVGPIGIELPEEARVWWRWHNGVKAGAPRRERCILHERELYSLESALDGCTEWWGALPELWAMNKKLLRPVGELPVIWIDVGGPRQEPVAIYTQNDGSQPPRARARVYGGADLDLDAADRRRRADSRGRRKLGAGARRRTSARGRAAPSCLTR